MLEKKSRITIPEAFVLGYEKAFETDVKVFRDQMFEMYGEDRLEQESFNRSFKMFRQRRHHGNLITGCGEITVQWVESIGEMSCDQLEDIVEVVNQEQGRELYGVRSSGRAGSESIIAYDADKASLGFQALKGMYEIGSFSLYHNDFSHRETKVSAPGYIG